MKRHAFTRSGAEQDIRGRFRYLAKEAGIGIANRFQQAVQEDVSGLLQEPEKGWTVRFRMRRLAGMRCWPVSGFEKVLIFYLPTDFGIEVVRVLHGARDVRRILREEG